MDPRKLGKKIRLGRVELDLTQTQLAEKIKTKQKSISRYETGASLSSMRTLVKTAKILKNPLDVCCMSKAKHSLRRSFATHLLEIGYLKRKMRKLMEEKNLIENGLHHQIYLSDPRRVPEEKTKTILR